MTDDKTSDGSPAPSKPFAAEQSIGPDALRAFAHPLRMALYGELGRRRSATASQLARALNESSGQTSYHLRQLERHGFVEDDPEHSGGRERWWRPVGFRLTDSQLARDPETQAAAHTVVREVIAERATSLTAWLENLAPGETESVGQLASSTVDLTDAEAEQLTEELGRVLDRYATAAKKRESSPDARRYRVHVDVFPLAGPS